jgi:uncharacterized protein YerC
MSSNIQIFIDVILFLAVAGVWLRIVASTKKDDPRLSRGLQLLQSKIAILEDLSDRIERQVQQSIQLMESKSKDLQKQFDETDQQIFKIDSAMAKSLDVAKMFQDRIPHEEIIERKSTAKFVKAARMAHQGVTNEEIVNELGLSMGEVEFVAKMNRQKLQFSEDELPEWAKEVEEFSSEPVLKIKNESLAASRSSSVEPKKINPFDDGVRKINFPRVDVTRNLA